MTDFSDKTFLVYDIGGNLHWAQMLVEQGVGNVLLHTPWLSYCPDFRESLVGRGIEGLERVDYFFDHLDEADVIIFPWVGFGDLQDFLRRQGYHVWGSGKAEVLEFDRWNKDKLSIELGLAVPDVKRIIGLENLEEYLKDPANDNQWLKRSIFRGDFESQHHENWALTEDWFRDLDHKMGRHRTEVEILCEENIEGVEVGYDGYTVDGQLAENCMWGYEVKDSSYIGRTDRMSKIPPQLGIVKKFSPVLRQLGARCNMHTEVRCTKEGDAYLRDFTMRVGSPPGELMEMQITNWPEIILNGSQGTLVEPVFDNPYGALLIISSDWAAQGRFVTIDVPPELANHVRLHSASMLDDGTYEHSPVKGMDAVGAVVATGKSPEEAIDETERIAKELKGYKIEYSKTAKDDLLKAIEEGEGHGLHF